MKLVQYWRIPLGIAIALFTLGGCATHSVKQHGQSFEFVMRLPEETQSVLLAASHDNFTYHTATRRAKDTWSITLDMAQVKPPIRYFTVIDGKTVLPDCPLREPDGFGGYNCVYEFKRKKAENDL